MLLEELSLEALSRETPDESPVDVILGIREELAEFRRNGGKRALRAKWRKACEEALLQTMRGPDPFEPALSGPQPRCGRHGQHLRQCWSAPPHPPRHNPLGNRRSSLPQPYQQRITSDPRTGSGQGRHGHHHPTRHPARHRRQPASLAGNRTGRWAR